MYGVEFDENRQREGLPVREEHHLCACPHAASRQPTQTQMRESVCVCVSQQGREKRREEREGEREMERREREMERRERSKRQVESEKATNDANVRRSDRATPDRHAPL